MFLAWVSCGCVRVFVIGSESQDGLQVLKPGTSQKYAQHSLGQYIREKGYSRAFISQYLLPMCAAVWSVPNAQVTH
jgi:predicted NAD/FAD-binding protein